MNADSSHISQAAASEADGSRLSALPFNPGRFPFFYGWVIVVMATLGVLMSMPGQTMGVSAFTEHLINALGLTRGQLSVTYMFGTIASALLLTSAGKLYDRWGSRVMACSSSVIMAAVLVVLSQCDRLSKWLAAWVGDDAGTWSAFGIMFVCFFLLRFSGQGILTLSSRNMLMKWFNHRRGLVNGLSGLFVSFGFSGTPLFLAWLIAWGGWRSAYVSLAVAAGLVFPVLVVVFFRDNPEECGLVPDGVPRGARVDTKDDHPVIHPFTLAESRKKLAFWVFAIPLAMNGLYVTGLTFHIESVFYQAGMPAAEAFAIFLPASFISVTLNLFGGWLSDKIHLKYLLLVMLGGSMMSYAGFFLLAPGWTKWLFIIGNGICGGLWNVLMAVTWPRYFGREHLGAITGFFMSLVVFASAIGPWLLSLTLDVTGAYGPAVLLFAGIAFTCFIFGLKVRNPQEDLAIAGTRR